MYQAEQYGSKAYEFKTVSEEMVYFYMVFQNHLAQLANDKKKENDVIVTQIQTLLKHCIRCKHCLADKTSANLNCTSFGKLNGPNDVGCNFMTRRTVGKIGDYTTEQ